MARGRFTWTDRSLFKGIEDLPNEFDEILRDAADYHRLSAIGYAKLNAPWTDRTGNARNGIDAELIHEPKKEYGFILYHKVPYGIWLEVSNSGRYAIIEDTLAYEGERLMETVRQVLS